MPNRIEPLNTAKAAVEYRHERRGHVCDFQPGFAHGLGENEVVAQYVSPSVLEPQRNHEILPNRTGTAPCKRPSWIEQHVRADRVPLRSDERPERRLRRKVPTEARRDTHGRIREGLDELPQPVRRGPD